MIHLNQWHRYTLLALTLACVPPLAAETHVQAQAQEKVQALIHAQLPASLREQASITVHINAPRGAAQRPCTSAWHWGSVDASQWQRIHIPVRCGAEPGSVVAQAQVRVPLHTPRQDLPQGHVLQHADMQVTVHSLRHASTVLAPEDWLGMQLRRAVMQGQPLQRSDMQRPLYARKGDRLEIRATQGDVVVSATGIALRKGYAGDVIRARNVHSQTWVEGVLIAPHVLQAQTLQPGSGVKVQSSD